MPGSKPQRTRSMLDVAARMSPWIAANACSAQTKNCSALRSCTRCCALSFSRNHCRLPLARHFVRSMWMTSRRWTSASSFSRSVGMSVCLVGRVATLGLRAPLGTVLAVGAEGFAGPLRLVLGVGRLGGNGHVVGGAVRQPDLVRRAGFGVLDDQSPVLVETSGA